MAFDHKGTQGEVAFLSIIDPKIHSLVPSLSDDGIQITEPVQAAQEIIDSLNLSPNPPELIVILTTAGADTQEAIRRTLKGAHLMIGDSTMATLRIEQRVTEFVNMGAHRKAAPLTVPMDGLAELGIFESGALKNFKIAPSTSPRRCHRITLSPQPLHKTDWITTMTMVISYWSQKSQEASLSSAKVNGLNWSVSH